LPTRDLVLRMEQEYNATRRMLGVS